MGGWYSGPVKAIPSVGPLRPAMCVARQGRAMGSFEAQAGHGSRRVARMPPFEATLVNQNVF